MSVKSYLDQIDREDPEISQAISAELVRQRNQLEMIASENLTHPAVMAAQGSVMTNKYAEGYPGRRYYDGCEYVDIAEELAIERACDLFGCAHANVQPHSGSQANQAVMLTLLKPGESILGMDLAAGGHLTHGAHFNQSGKIYDAHFYQVDPDTFLLDYDKIEVLAEEHQPKLIIAGASAYPRQIDFERFRAIADKVGAYLMADVAHYAGLIAGGVYPDPFPHAHVVTTTTHKTLRGPRGGMILTNEKALAKKFNSAVFPGIQGGPLMHVIAAKAIAFKQAQTQSFKDYAKAVKKHARIIAEGLQRREINVISNGTDSHMILVDLRSHEVTGKATSKTLDHIGITCNLNAIPYDTISPLIASGIRLGTPALTTRGLDAASFAEIADIIADTIEQLSQALKSGHKELPETSATALRSRVDTICQRYPLYPEYGGN